MTPPSREELTGIWKTLATTITTVVIAMAGFWLVEAREYPTRSEVSVMIARESPYVKDQGLIVKQLTDMERVNTEITKTLSLLRTEITELQVMIRARGNN